MRKHLTPIAFSNSQFIIRNYTIIFFLFLSISLSAQTWTDPINISNMPGLDNQPDLCIDKNGVLHCVFTHKLASNWRKIYYTKSTNDGATWTTPEDISLNPDTSLMNPHIVVDTNNIIYVTYDYNTMNPAATLIKLKTFDGSQWSTPFVVSEGMYNSDHNQLYIDYKNRLYCFWYRDGKSFYRYLEDKIWSGVFIPYENEYYWLLASIVIDGENNLKCAGVYLEEGQTITQIKIIFCEYIYQDEIWSDKTIISDETYIGSGNLNIDLDNSYKPHVVYRQYNEYSGPNNDSTMYTFFDGNNWSSPELVVNDPFEQKIAIDLFNRVHIVDREKLETGTKLVHYQKINDLWQGYIIDNSNIIVANPVFIEKNNILYLVYYKCFSNNDCRIRFTKNYLLTDIQRKEILMKEFNIYPNPFSIETIIEFGIDKEVDLNISVNDINGKNLNTIDERKFSTGKYNYKWNGTDKNGKEVTSGTYLIRLQAGRHVISKPVEKMK